MPKAASPSKQKRNPVYEKIGKRIRQARIMAKETNSRALSERLGWSAGRINNFETGISTPGVEETLQFCEAVGADPCWVTYGVGSPRASSLQATRHRNLITIVDEAEQSGALPDLLAAIQLTPERLAKHRENPFKEIPDRLARRCERFTQQRRGSMDESPAESGYCESLPDDMRELLALYARLSDADKQKLFAMGRLLIEED
ncbi:helix-turn-helix domain-containing protein [Thiosocius teredinicola]|uniref:helix-turn-helix domain-containing protein n=1 Tax=Thiosocius teredinicola TaxID=1973002 RepID=UPI0009910EE6